MCAEARKIGYHRIQKKVEWMKTFDRIKNSPVTLCIIHMKWKTRRGKRSETLVFYKERLFGIISDIFSIQEKHMGDIYNSGCLPQLNDKEALNVSDWSAAPGGSAFQPLGNFLAYNISLQCRTMHYSVDYLTELRFESKTFLYQVPPSARIRGLAACTHMCSPDPIGWLVVGTWEQYRALFVSWNNSPLRSKPRDKA